jgi:hypothetical protein
MLVVRFRQDWSAEQLSAEGARVGLTQKSIHFHRNDQFLLFDDEVSFPDITPIDLGEGAFCLKCKKRFCGCPERGWENWDENQAVKPSRKIPVFFIQSFGYFVPVSMLEEVPIP